MNPYLLIWTGSKSWKVKNEMFHRSSKILNEIIQKGKSSRDKCGIGYAVKFFTHTSGKITSIKLMEISFSKKKSSNQLLYALYAIDWDTTKVSSTTSSLKIPNLILIV